MKRMTATCQNVGSSCRGESQGGESNEKTEDPGQNAGEHQHPRENFCVWHYSELEKFYNHIFMKGRERKALKENKRWSWRKEKYQEGAVLKDNGKSFKEFHSFI